MMIAIILIAGGMFGMGWSAARMWDSLWQHEPTTDELIDDKL